MRRSVNSLFICILASLLLSVSAAEESLKEGQLIRRVYLDLLGIPPTPKELNWYLTYNKPDPLKRAVNDIVQNNESLKEFLLSEDYKKKPLIPLSSLTLDLIVKYQSGMLKNSLEEADRKLVDISLKVVEDDLNPLDFMAECLIGRVTTAQEETELLKIIKKYPSEEEGYLEALKIIKTFPDFLNK